MHDAVPSLSRGLRGAGLRARVQLTTGPIRFTSGIQGEPASVGPVLAYPRLAHVLDCEFPLITRCVRVQTLDSPGYPGAASSVREMSDSGREPPAWTVVGPQLRKHLSL